MAALTALKVKSASPGRHCDAGREGVRGLHLVVSPTGGRSWVLRIQKQGARRDFGLGGWPDVDLQAAREKARSMRSAMARGEDAIALRDKAKVQVPNFRDAAIATHDGKRAGWGDRTARSFLSTLEAHAFPKIGSRRVDTIDENDILSILTPLWVAKPAVAKKLRNWTGLILDYAKGRQWRSIGAPRDGLRPLLSKQSAGRNFAAIPYVDLPPFMAELRGKPITMGRLALMFTVLTAARSGEVRGMLWSHVDLDGGWWHRPASAMKAREAHSVTLSTAAIEILKIAKRLWVTKGDTFVFPGVGGKQLSDMTMSKIVKPLGVTVHGMRSSFRDWAAEMHPTVPDAVAEEALAHKVGTAVERAYKRTRLDAMRRELLGNWGNFLFSADPLPLRAAR